LSTPSANQFVILAEEEGVVVGFASAYGRDDDQWSSLLDNSSLLEALARG